jgi:hypothetical protein
VQVPVLLLRQDVELLAPVGGVPVTDQPELLEHVERPIHGGRDGRGLPGATPFDELCAGDVAVGLGQRLDDRPALRSPAQPALAQPLVDGAPRGLE